MQIVERLKATSLFASLSPDSLQRLAQACQSRSLSAGEFLFFQDEPGDRLYLLLDGTIRLYRSGADGREVVIKTVLPGELFAEVILFETRTYPVTATAAQDSALLALRRGDLLRLLDLPSFRDEFIRGLFLKMRYMASQMHARATEDPGQRLIQWLREHYGTGHRLVVDLPKKEVAQAINVTPETLSRTLLKLRNEGKLAWNRNQVVFGPEEE